MQRLAIFITTLWAGTALATPPPEEIVATVARLEATTLDAARSFPAEGQELNRDGLVAQFTSGSFSPIAREDGRVVGLVFEGEGVLDVRIPAGVETAAWQATTDHAPLQQPFNAAYLRFSDLTVDDLQGERPWSEGGDPGGSLFRLYENRTELLADPQWTRMAPNLLVDRLRDLYGGGAVGGHLLAEFRLAGDGPPDWLGYYHNKRGALLEGETTAWYRARRRGGAPPEVTILASFGSHPSATPEYDVSYTDLDVTFPTAVAAGRDLVDAEIRADIGLVSLNPYGLETVVFELAARRNLCGAQSDRPDLTVKRVVDGDGNALAALHLGDRLVIPLAHPVGRGEPLALTIEYAGAVTQGIPIGPADTSFSEIGPWAFYPRNPSLDRFASKVSLHLPRFLRGVAPGDLVETREEKGGWHYTFEEAGGVETLMIVVGDFVRSKPKDEGSSPRVVTWIPRHMQDNLPNAAGASRGLVESLSGIWGAYPYSTLHVVNTVGYPANNWQISNDGNGGRWTCLPPGPLHPWEAFAQGASGMLIGAVTSPPANDVIEARFIDRYAMDGLSAGTYMQFMNLARQWWGHMVPPKTYRDLWLTEALVGWTGLTYLRAGAGRAALKEQAVVLRDMASEGTRTGLPMGLGERLGRDFFFSVWGAGPLLIDTLITDLGPGPFANAMNTLVNRASGPGVTTELFLESLRGLQAERSVRLVEAMLAGAKPPRVEFSTAIDKESGAVHLEFIQVDEPLPINVAVEVVWSPKHKEMRVAKLEGPTTQIDWSFDEPPKRVNIDPLNLALVSGMRKMRGGPADEPEETEE